MEISSWRHCQGTLFEGILREDEYCVQVYGEMLNYSYN